VDTVGPISSRTSVKAPRVWLAGNQPSGRASRDFRAGFRTNYADQQQNALNLCRVFMSLGKRTASDSQVKLKKSNNHRLIAVKQSKAIGG
jgi:hypothetical protein